VTCGSLRVILTDPQRSKKKPLLLEHRRLDEVYKEAKKRLNLKKIPKKAVTTDGNDVTNDMLTVMQNDTLIVILQ
jgi:hypothetical protein